MPKIPIIQTTKTELVVKATIPTTWTADAIEGSGRFDKIFFYQVAADGDQPDRAARRRDLSSWGGRRSVAPPAIPSTCQPGEGISV
jgi:hypothetical protein